MQEWIAATQGSRGLSAPEVFLMPLLHDQEKLGNGQSGVEASNESDRVRSLLSSPHSVAEPPDHRAPPTLLAKPTAAGLLLALRRRLAVALPLAAICATVAGVAAWTLTPGNKSLVHGLVQIDSDPEAVLGNIHGGSNNAAQFANYQKTQSSLIRSQAVISEALRDPAVASLSMLREQSSPSEWLAEALEADFKPGPEVLRVALQGSRPEEMVRIVNAVVNAYVDFCRRTDADLRQQRLTHLLELRTQNEKALGEKRRILSLSASTLASGDPAKSAGLYELKLKQLEATNEELRKCQSDRLRLERKLKIQQEQMQNSETPVLMSQVDSELSNDKTVKQLQEDIARQESLINIVRANAPTPAVADELLQRRGNLEVLAVNQAALARRHSELRPAVIARLRSQAQAQLQIDLQETSGQLADLAEQDKKLAALAAALERDTQASGSALIKLNEAAKDVTEQERIVRGLEDDVRHLELRRLAPPRVRLLDAAVLVPPKPSKLQMGVTGIAILAALIGALALVGLYEFQQRRITCVDEVIYGFGIDVVGTLPPAPIGKWRSGSAATMPIGSSAATGTDRTFAAMNAFVTLLWRKKTWGKSGLIMVTSAEPCEGRSTVASELAKCLALSGRRTLLLRGDSLAAVSAGKALPEPTQAASVRGLWIVDGGKSQSPTPASWTEDGIHGTLNELKQAFDIIILDAEPVLTAATTLTLAQHVDGVVIAVRRQQSRMPQVAAALHQLRLLGTGVLGAVLLGTEESAYGSTYQLPTKASI